MLSVSLSLAMVAPMLIDIVLPGHHKEVDSLNGPTPGPIPGRDHEMVMCRYKFKWWDAHYKYRTVNCGNAPYSCAGQPRCQK
jgi:hypothetical protein